MKAPVIAIALSILAKTSHAQAPEAVPKAPQVATKVPEAAPKAEAKLVSNVFALADLPVEARDNGVRRAVFDAPTATVDRLHAHITTLNPGKVSGEPRLHQQEEVLIVTQGSIEAHFNGQQRLAGPGSIIFFAANSVTFLKNPGPEPATYYVMYYYTPLTPKAEVAAGSKAR